LFKYLKEDIEFFVEIHKTLYMRYENNYFDRLYSLFKFFKKENRYEAFMDELKIKYLNQYRREERLQKEYYMEIPYIQDIFLSSILKKIDKNTKRFLESTTVMWLGVDYEIPKYSTIHILRNYADEIVGADIINKNKTLILKMHLNFITVINPNRLSKVTLDYNHTHSEYNKNRYPLPRYNIKIFEDYVIRNTPKYAFHYVSKNIHPLTLLKRGYLSLLLRDNYTLNGVSIMKTVKNASYTGKQLKELTLFFQGATPSTFVNGKVFDNYLSMVNHIKRKAKRFNKTASIIDERKSYMSATQINFLLDLTCDVEVTDRTITISKKKSGKTFVVSSENFMSMAQAITTSMLDEDLNKIKQGFTRVDKHTKWHIIRGIEHFFKKQLLKDEVFKLQNSENITIITGQNRSIAFSKKSKMIFPQKIVNEESHLVFKYFNRTVVGRADRKGVPLNFDNLFKMSESLVMHQGDNIKRLAIDILAWPLRELLELDKPAIIASNYNARRYYKWLIKNNPIIKIETEDISVYESQIDVPDNAIRLKEYFPKELIKELSIAKRFEETSNHIKRAQMYFIFEIMTAYNNPKIDKEKIEEIIYQKAEDLFVEFRKVL